MGKKLFFVCTIVISLSIINGCTYMEKDTTVRHYLQDKKRVDLGMHGNAGYLMGAPDNLEKPAKDTRKIYVVEFTKDNNSLDDIEFGGEGVVKKTVMIDDDNAQATEARIVDSRPKVNMPTFEDPKNAWGMEDDEMNEAVEFIEYKVEKNDTLQKISKKFYDSYSKWPKIYDVNREVIKDPNFVKPGIIIKIPDVK